MTPRGRCKSISREEFRAEVCGWAEATGLRPRQIRIQDMKRKWASCSRAGRVCFAAGLLARKKRLRDVVIVHELIHLRVRNHGKLFRSLMHALVPGWESAAGDLDRLV